MWHRGVTKTHGGRRFVDQMPRNAWRNWSLASSSLPVPDGGPGKTWSPEDFRTALGTLRRVIAAWPDETRCYQGHCGPFRLGDIRSAVEAFIARDHGRFCGDATWGM